MEQEVATHPAVRLAGAVAIPDPTYGERVAIVVELEARTTLTLKELLDHLSQRGTSPEIWPEHLVVVDALPLSTGGKVAKGELREMVAR